MTLASRLSYSEAPPSVPRCFGLRTPGEQRQVRRRPRAPRGLVPTVVVSTPPPSAACSGERLGRTHPPHGMSLTWTVRFSGLQPSVVNTEKKKNATAQCFNSPSRPTRVHLFLGTWFSLKSVAKFIICQDPGLMRTGSARVF